MQGSFSLFKNEIKDRLLDSPESLSFREGSLASLIDFLFRSFEEEETLKEEIESSMHSIIREMNSLRSFWLSLLEKTTREVLEKGHAAAHEFADSYANGLLDENKDLLKALETFKEKKQSQIGLSSFVSLKRKMQKMKEGLETTFEEVFEKFKEELLSETLDFSKNEETGKGERMESQKNLKKVKIGSKEMKKCGESPEMENQIKRLRDSWKNLKPELEIHTEEALGIENDFKALEGLAHFVSRVSLKLGPKERHLTEWKEEKSGVFSGAFRDKVFCEKYNEYFEDMSMVVADKNLNSCEIIQKCHELFGAKLKGLAINQT